MWGPPLEMVGGGFQNGWFACAGMLVGKPFPICRNRLPWEGSLSV